MNKLFSVVELEEILKKAISNATAKIDEELAKFKESDPETFEQYGEPMFPCGFAWVEINGVKGNTKLGKNLVQAGKNLKLGNDCNKSIWNPTKYFGQNVDMKEVGTYAFAQTLKEFGFDAVSVSRLD